MSNQIKYYEEKLAYESDSFDVFEALAKGDNIIIVDTRSAESYYQEHIPHAISLPHRSISSESTKLLDKNKTYICYCDGIGCNASTKGALNLAKLGYNVKELIGGLDWWKRDGYETEGINGLVGKEVLCGC